MFFRKKEKAVSSTPQDETSMGAKAETNCGAKSTSKTVKAVSSSAKSSAKNSCSKACSGKMNSSAKACSGRSSTKTISDNCKCAK